MESNGNSGERTNLPSPCNPGSPAECQGRSGEGGASCEIPQALQRKTIRSIARAHSFDLSDVLQSGEFRCTLNLCGQGGDGYEAHGKRHPNASAICHRGPNTSSAA